ncbi:DUF808 domain-containing protein [Raineyella fluvialis]|uniref:DUF808 family protein n=1 Tax=Raineyella fluvialis TaxID=2662261 RepID=A0A5Q2FCJ8_9ACTN|nr:DUF808 domain-containing protein [Raineyella fluvialis]QGF23154.1 DUF808 family protein [Raineyella fluvialis]
MAGGLAALLDDVAMIAKAASATSTKTVGVVVDDTAVAPQYVAGIHPSRELPVVWRIGRGSLLNKAILIAVLLVLDRFLPVVLTPLLMLGGLYLSFEGAEKVLEAFRGGHGEDGPSGPAVERGADSEKALIRGAVRTDFILSAEIMVISLAGVNAGQGAGMGLVPKMLTLAVVGVVLTVLVYGVVALIVKMDDMGLALKERERPATQRIGAALVRAMPTVLSVLSTVGIAAMLWVGGHILISGANTLGWHAPADLLHHLAAPAHEVPGVGGFLAWLIDTLGSGVVALVIGGVLTSIAHLLPFRRHDAHESAEARTSAQTEGPARTPKEDGPRQRDA